MIRNETDFTCDCGFTWLFGESGSHNCRPYYQATITKLEEEKRMWFDRYATLYNTCDRESIIFKQWAIEVDREYG